MVFVITRRYSGERGKSPSPIRADHRESVLRFSAWWQANASFDRTVGFKLIQRRSSSFVPATFGHVDRPQSTVPTSDGTPAISSTASSVLPGISHPEQILRVVRAVQGAQRDCGTKILRAQIGRARLRRAAAKLPS